MQTHAPRGLCAPRAATTRRHNECPRHSYISAVSMPCSTFAAECGAQRHLASNAGRFLRGSQMQSGTHAQSCGMEKSCSRKGPCSSQNRQFGEACSSKSPFWKGQSRHWLRHGTRPSCCFVVTLLVQDCCHSVRGRKLAANQEGSHHRLGSARSQPQWRPSEATACSP